MPEISIIIPVYKVEKYICECVDSILAQEYKDFEIILVDDGSPDRCPEICDNYANTDNRIKVIHKPNGGLSSARNAGLAQAKGRYVWFVDSDDLTEKNALSVLSEYFDFSASIIKFNVNRFNRRIKENKKDIDNVFSGEADHKDICRIAEKACSSSLFPYVWRNVYSRNFLEKNDLRFVEGLSYVEDGVFNSQAYFLAEKIIFLDDYLYVYRYRQNGLSKVVDEKFNYNYYESLVLYDRQRDENYSKYCQFPSDEYYKDAGKFTLEKIYQYMLIPRVYLCGDKNKFRLFKMISKSEMVKKAFGRFDINEIKSRSLDWWMLWAVRHKLYLAGHLICKHILFKNRSIKPDPIAFD